MSHSRQTEHYELPLYNGTDIINPLTDFNNANEAIDEAIYNANQRSVNAENTARSASEAVGQYDERITEAINKSEEAEAKTDEVAGMISDTFNPLKTGGYKVDDIVIYNDKLYEFVNNHTGAWDGSDVRETTISEIIGKTKVKLLAESEG